ncbi:MAG TPA: hypothetical protein VIP11_23800, partial [Gemmatimonadaceae bacterium]
MSSNLSRRAWHRATVALSVALLAACARQEGERPNLSGDVHDVRAVRLDTRRDLRESSGAAMSRRQGAVVFMIDDSGNAPTLFALDTNGIDRGAWRVVGAKNTDWESLSTGPCAATSDANKDCVYIGDTGDNTERRPERAIYRLVEPEAKGGDDTVHASRLRYVYADGPHDVEAMYVAKNGDVLLITKRPRTNATGQLRPALVFALPTSGAWDKDSVRTA